MNRTYPWNGGEERLRTEGETKTTQILILPALFDEANRMRRFTVQLMHALVERDIGTLLPDLPGTGDSIRELADMSWADWTKAVGVVAGRLPAGERLTVAIRGGALLGRCVGADLAHRAWQLSPEPGQRLLADLDRAARVARRDTLGYAMTEDLRTSLAAATPEPANRVVRLASDRAAADRHVEGPALWRRAEPDENFSLVEQVADDIAAWVGR